MRICCAHLLGVIDKISDWSDVDDYDDNDEQSIIVDDKKQSDNMVGGADGSSALLKYTGCVNRHVHTVQFYCTVQVM